MKAKYTFVFLYLIIFPSISTIGISLLISSNTITVTPQLSAPINGVSNFQIAQNVSYQVEMNYTLTHTKVAPQTYIFKVARLNDRQPNSPLTPYCPPYQILESLESNISKWDGGEIEEGFNDKFNNTYDRFNVTLDNSEEITVNYKYNITLNDIYFNDIDSGDIGSYNPGDEIHTLYNVTETFYNCSHPDLIARSNDIVGSLTNPVDKAREIFNWIAINIEYEEQNQEIGAYEAYIQRKGDCSDISDLMITLLRIQSIPARKVTGFLISRYPSHRPTVDNKYLFDLNYVGATETQSFTNQILGHAWVEYFIPSIGWIACDPTWKEGYFNGIDFLRFNLNVGAWFYLPGATPPFDYISEFPLVPSPVCSDHTAYDFQFTIEVTVIETNLRPPGELPLIFVIFTIVGVGAVTTLMFLLRRRGGKKLIPYYDK
ncbi:MAG: transglutaminase family protein [Candidatus Hermodarchaeota archaeon]